MRQESILVVDDEAVIRRALEKFLTDLGYHVGCAGTVDEGIALAERRPFDAALVDLMMPERNGIELVQALHARDPELVAIVMTGFGTISSAVEAMRAGAYHYLTKPFELEAIRQLVGTALEYRRLRVENRALKVALQQQVGFPEIIGRSPVMGEVFDLIEKVAATDSTVLLLGESGTGKELVARALHHRSHRTQGPFVAVNCGAIPEDLLEAELFGHVRGAFTGAVATRAGKFEAAHGGTILLDEIGEMSPKLQVKLLRVLQERRFEPVGSAQVMDVDVRIVAATNQDLEVAVQDRRFREDLYYRLNVIPVKLPNLQERTGDVALLAQHFLDHFNQVNGRAVSGFSRDAVACLEQYRWPGNVRELENLIERIVVLKGQGVVEVADLPAALQTLPQPYQPPQVVLPVTGLSLKAAVLEFEQSLIQQALQMSGGNKNRAAGLLQLNRTTLVEKLRRQQGASDAPANQRGDYV
ncbi:MAG: sigma-54-dependent Fis family transcriptional regulator [Deltaproteobacteria bacterium]|nr:sigma-54-dependent Fis family transcriptional regulator [Deltaproteobacteria bacterium]